MAFAQYSPSYWLGNIEYTDCITSSYWFWEQCLPPPAADRGEDCGTSGWPLLPVPFGPHAIKNYAECLTSGVTFLPLPSDTNVPTTGLPNRLQNSPRTLIMVARKLPTGSAKKLIFARDQQHGCWKDVIHQHIVLRYPVWGVWEYLYG